VTASQAKRISKRCAVCTSKQKQRKKRKQRKKQTSRGWQPAESLADIHPTMKCVTIRIMLFLLLGAVVNVAVAWVIGVAPADYSRPVGFAEPASDQPSRLANQMAMLAGTTTSKRYEFFNRFHATYGVQGVPDLDAVIPYWAAQYLSEEDLNRSRDAAYLVTARATGWPALSMSGGMRLNLSGITIEQSDWAILLPPPKPSRVDQSRIVPLRPIWPGFAINTVFYAAMFTILWLLTLSPFTARRMVRRRRGWYRL